MLIRFIVENFLSFKEETEFNMLTGQFKIHKDHIYPVGSNIDLLKVASIYGANGSGKSNLVRSIDFLQSTIMEGTVEKSVKKLNFRLDHDYESKPSSFEAEFGFNGSFYSFGLRILGSKIVEEWLYKLEFDKKVEDKKIYERTLSDKKEIQISVHEDLLKSEEDRLLIKVYQEQILKHSDLFLKLIIEKYEDAGKAFHWWNNRLSIIYPDSRAVFLLGKCLTDEGFKNFSNNLLKTFSTGIDELDIATVPLEVFLGDDDKDLQDTIIEGLKDDSDSIVRLLNKRRDVVAVMEDDKPVVKKLVTKHKTANGEPIFFEIEDESDGTRRLLDFIPAIEMVNNSEGVVIIDEIDQSIHPALLKTFLAKVLEKKDSKGQLIFTTHESNLLDLNLFRQDEVWFSEKDTTGATKMYSLSDYKPRYDLDIRKGYLKGRFGALPFLGNLKDLNWEENA